MTQKDEMELRLTLKEMGGRYWEKGLYKRVYFNKAELLNVMGIDIDYLKNKASMDFSGVGPEKMLLNALESITLNNRNCDIVVFGSQGINTVYNTDR